MRPSISTTVSGWIEQCRIFSLQALIFQVTEVETVEEHAACITLGAKINFRVSYEGSNVAVFKRNQI